MNKMRQGLVSLILAFFAICSYAQNKGIDFLLNKLYDGGKSDYVMIVAHRGNWRNAPENSLQAYKQCIDAGIDGVEIDVQLTKDSNVVVIHDNTLDRTTNGSGLVKDYTLTQIKELNLRSPIGMLTRQKVPTLDEVLELCKGKVLIQIDKWIPIKEKVIDVVNKHSCQNQVILRGTFNTKTFHDKYEKLLKDFIFSPVIVCNGVDDEAKLDDYMNNVDTPIMSLSFKDDKYPILNKVQNIKQKGFRIWYNSLWATFNGGHDDEIALDNPEESYGWLLQHGANIIFSDNPFQLLRYLTLKNRR